VTGHLRVVSGGGAVTAAEPDDFWIDFERDVAPMAEAPRSHLRLVDAPRMHPGPGVRHECVHESECLGRALQAEPLARFVHCPEFCKHLQAASFEERLGLSGGRAEGNFR
jgi:hypothetical protein